MKNSSDPTDNTSGNTATAESELSPAVQAARTKAAERQQRQTNLYSKDVLSLIESDYVNLERGAISRATADAARLYRITTAVGKEIFGRRDKADYAGIVIPYHEPDKNTPRGSRLRRDNPPMRNGKEQAKYLSPPGQRNQFYYPPEVTPEMLADAGLLIIFTEGEKKALAVWQWAKERGKDVLVIGLSGVYGWCGVTGKRKGGNGRDVVERGPIADFDEINWKERPTLVIFDADAAVKPDVRRARTKFKTELERRGAKVRIVSLPANGPKGIDDLIAAKRGDELAAMIFTPIAEAQVVQAELTATLANGDIVTCEPQGRGKALVIATRAGDMVVRDTLNLNSLDDRNKLIKALKLPEGEQDAAQGALMLLAGALTVAAEEAEAEQPQRAGLIAFISARLDLFHDEVNECFATIQNEGRHETYALNSSDLASWLKHEVYKATGRGAGDAFAEVIEIMAGKARFDAPQRAAHLRVAQHGEAFYLDLCNEQWQQVEVTATGWRVIESANSPVRFIRSSTMLPLPTPEKGGDLNDLRKALNITPRASKDAEQIASGLALSEKEAKAIADANWAVVLAWLITAFHSYNVIPISYFILMVFGPSGAGKSTIIKILSSFIDPNKADLRSMPREVRDVAIATKHAWIIAYDNMRKIANELSDFFCILSTGGTYAIRANYTDTSEVVLTARRPLVLGGIAETATESDALSRAIPLQLADIPEDAKRSEAETFDALASKRAGILGKLLDAVSGGLLRRANNPPKFKRLPRMADAILWAECCAKDLGLDQGEILDAFMSARETTSDLVLEANPVAAVMLRFAQCPSDAGWSGGRWSNTMAALLTALDETRQKQGWGLRPPANWPGSARALSVKLREVEPVLKARGVTISREGHSESGNKVAVSYTRPTPPEKNRRVSPEPSPEPSPELPAEISPKLLGIHVQDVQVLPQLLQGKDLTPEHVPEHVPEHLNCNVQPGVAEHVQIDVQPHVQGNVQALTHLDAGFTGSPEHPEHVSPRVLGKSLGNSRVRPIRYPAPIFPDPFPTPLPISDWKRTQEDVLIIAANRSRLAMVGQIVGLTPPPISADFALPGDPVTETRLPSWSERHGLKPEPKPEEVDADAAAEAEAMRVEYADAEAKQKAKKEEMEDF